jgi:hypothetical protein
LSEPQMSAGPGRGGHHEGMDEDGSRTEAEQLRALLLEARSWAWAFEHRMSDGVHASLSGTEVPPPEWLISSVPPWETEEPAC